MRTIFTLCFLLSLGFVAQAQDLNILLVDDSDDFFDNTDVIAAGLTNSGIGFETFNAVGTSMGPWFDFLSNYDLVIWHTSTDDNGLYFWNQDEEDNGNLALYLEQGGNLWLIGNDFLFDRYEVPPDTFQMGDFVYDKLGISIYDAQAYGDDDNFGVPLVRPVENQPINGLQEINWQFPTLWWADALTPRAEAVAIYEMGHDNYVFAGAPTGIWYDNGTSKALTFAFDLALANNQEQVDNTVASVVNYFSSVIVSTADLPATVSSFQVFPNPVVNQATLSLDLEKEAQVQVDLLTMNGQLVGTLLPNSKLSSGEHKVEWLPNANLPNGIYQVRISVDHQLASRSVMLAR